jgi:hypothetical protein
MVCLSWLSDMVPNWRVLNDGWGTGAERWFESPDVAIADTGNEGRKGDPFLVNLCVSGQVLGMISDAE